MNYDLEELVSIMKSLHQSEVKYIDPDFSIWLSNDGKLHYMLEGQYEMLENKTVADFNDVLVNYLSV